MKREFKLQIGTGCMAGIVGIVDCDGQVMHIVYREERTAESNLNRAREYVRDTLGGVVVSEKKVGNRRDS